MIIQPRAVVTPWSTPTASSPRAPGPANVTSRGDAASISSPPAAPLESLPSAAPDSRPPLLRSLLLGLSVAASLAGPMAAPALAAPPPAISVSPASQSSRDALVEQLLSASSRASAGDLARARTTLQTVPQNVLQLLARNGTRIVIMQPGQTPSDVGVVRPVDLKSYDAPDLAARGHDALQRIDRLYGPRIAALEHRLETIQDADNDDGPSPAAVAARTDLERLQQERDVIARRAVHEATDGLLEPAMTEEAASMGRLARISPVSLRDLADSHDAHTEADVAEYENLVQRINGNRIDAAQRAYGVDEHTLPPDGRSMMAYDSQILVPAFRYTAPSTRIAVHDLEADAEWRAQGVRGQYFYRGDLNTVLVAADALGPQQDGHDVLLHELGHAYEDARQTLQPQGFSSYLAARDAAFTRIDRTPHHPYRGEHAGSAPGEMGAQTFADAIAHRDGALRKADPTWMRAFDTWRAEADR